MGPGLLAPIEPDDDGGAPRFDVAIDAAGGGGARRYTYAVPPDLADLAPRRGGPRRVRPSPGARRRPRPTPRRPTGSSPSPSSGRVRADGPLLPPLSLRLAAWIADHYLAPPALVLRAMLPPGLLERLELLAERTAIDAPPDLPPAERTSWTSSPEARDRSVTSLPPRAAPACSGGSGRLPIEASSTLDWTLLAAGAGPRYERWIRLTRPDGRAAAAAGEPRPAGPWVRASSLRSRS